MHSNWLWAHAVTVQAQQQQTQTPYRQPSRLTVLRIHFLCAFVLCAEFKRRWSFVTRHTHQPTTGRSISHHIGGANDGNAMHFGKKNHQVTDFPLHHHHTNEYANVRTIFEFLFEFIFSTFRVCRLSYANRQTKTILFLACHWHSMLLSSCIFSLPDLRLSSSHTPWCGSCSFVVERCIIIHIWQTGKLPL